VEGFAGDLKRKLDRGEQVVFDNIGSFVNNSEGNILFEPDSSTNYLLDSFGFESFQYQPVERYDVRKKIMKYPRKPSRHISTRKLLWRAAVVIPLITLMVAVPLRTDLFKTRVQTTTLNPLVKAEFEHNKTSLEAERSANTTVTSSPSPEPVPAPKASVWVPPSQRTGYFVVTGCFKSEQNALLQASQLREEGYLPEVNVASNGLFRVCAIFCEVLDQALLKKDSVAKKYPGSWLAKKK
jgi:hypothetical protein